MRVTVWILLVCTLFTATTTNADTLTNTELVARIQRGDVNAILDAGKSDDKTLVPMLQGMARPHVEPRIDPKIAKLLTPQQLEEVKQGQKIPVYDRRAAKTARMALARLGVKEYLDEILVEVVSPTNSPVYKEREECPGFAPSKGYELSVQAEAFQKLVYIRDRSTVKVVATFLSAKENPSYYNVGGDMIFDLPSELAMQALAQMADNPPQIDLPAASETHDARLKIWQQWWEQNKGKYQ